MQVFTGSLPLNFTFTWWGDRFYHDCNSSVADLGISNKISLRSKVMSGVLKFIVFCLLLYTAFMLLLKVPMIESGINSGFRSSVEWLLQQAFPEAYIETQNFVDGNKQVDPNSFYLVYGNPKTIAEEEAYAAQQQLKEYKISTFSFQFSYFKCLLFRLCFCLLSFGKSH